MTTINPNGASARPDQPDAPAGPRWVLDARAAVRLGLDEATLGRYLVRLADEVDRLHGLSRATPRPAAPVLPSTVWVVRATYDPHPAEGVYLSEAAADAAAYVIAGDAARSYPGRGGYTVVVTPAGDIAASVLAQPLHTDDTRHGLPVVEQKAVAAALGKSEWQNIDERRYSRVVDGRAWDLEHFDSGETAPEDPGEGWYLSGPQQPRGEWLGAEDLAEAQRRADGVIKVYPDGVPKAVRLGAFLAAATARAVANVDEPADNRCHNCLGPGPLVPHLYGMRVCQTCFPEPDAFAATAEGGDR